jgi:hypothetical protein
MINDHLHGVFIVPTGFRFEKPRPGNPCGAWAAADYRGIRGFISTAGKFLKNNHLDYLDQLDHLNYNKKIFSATEKNLKNPENPAFTIRPGEIGTSPGLAKRF